MRIGVAFAGGGIKGAFSAGAAECLSTEGKIDFDVISGVSTGSLVGVLVAQDEYEKLNDIYRNVKTKYIIKRNILPTDIWKKALYDTSPLKKLIDDYVNPEFLVDKWPDRKLIIKTTNMRTGTVREFFNRPKDKKVLKKAVLASASMPFFMDKVKIGTDKYADAGLKDIAPVRTLLDEDLDLIYVVTTSPLETKIWDKNPDSILEDLERTIDIMLDEIFFNDIGIAQLMAKVRGLSGKKQPEIVVIRPEKHLPASPLDFDGAPKVDMWLAGWDAAQKVLDSRKKKK